MITVFMIIIIFYPWHDEYLKKRLTERIDFVILFKKGASSNHISKSGSVTPSSVTI